MSTSTSLPLSRVASADVVLRAAADVLAAGRSVVLATVLARHGSSPATPGQKLVLLNVHDALGTIGGGELEATMLSEMVELLGGASGEPILRRVDLGAELGMACGGSVELLLEPLVAAVTVLVVGAGHVGSSLAPMLADLGFRVVLCDARPGVVAALAEARSPLMHVVCGTHDGATTTAAVGPAPRRAAVLTMTHDHELDERVVEWALRERFAFVGGVGSKRKAAKLRAGLESRGIDRERVDSLSMPLGVEIGARTPAEIAVSIAAQLVTWRSRGGAVQGANRGDQAPDR